MKVKAHSDGNSKLETDEALLRLEEISSALQSLVEFCRADPSNLGRQRMAARIDSKVREAISLTVYDFHNG